MTERKTWQKLDEEGWKQGAKKAAGLLGGKVGERPWRGMGAEIGGRRKNKETIARSARVKRTAKAIEDQKSEVGNKGRRRMNL